MVKMNIPASVLDDLGNPRKLRLDINAGFNATGVIHDRLIIRDGEAVRVSTMPAPYVDQCIDEVKRLSDATKRRRPGGVIHGRIPMVLWQAWRDEWKRGPKQHGVLWRAFFNSKFMDRDYSKFRVDT